MVRARVARAISVAPQLNKRSSCRLTLSPLVELPARSAEVRNPALVGAFEDFEKDVREGRAQPTDFLQGLVEAAAQRDQ